MEEMGIDNRPVRFLVCMVVKIQVEFWVVTLYSVMVGYHCFRGPYYLHIHVEVTGGNGKNGHFVLKIGSMDL
jgi:hypothetical protein